MKENKVYAVCGQWIDKADSDYLEKSWSDMEYKYMSPLCDTKELAEKWLHEYITRYHQTPITYGDKKVVLSNNDQVELESALSRERYFIITKDVFTSENQFYTNKED